MAVSKRGDQKCTFSFCCFRNINVCDTTLVQWSTEYGELYFCEILFCKKRDAIPNGRLASFVSDNRSKRNKILGEFLHRDLAWDGKSGLERLLSGRRLYFSGLVCLVNHHYRMTKAWQKMQIKANRIRESLANSPWPCPCPWFERPKGASNPGPGVRRVIINTTNEARRRSAKYGRYVTCSRHVQRVGCGMYSREEERLIKAIDIAIA